MTRDEAQEVLKILEQLKKFTEVDKILNTFVEAFLNKSLFRNVYRVSDYKSQPFENGLGSLMGNFNLGGTVSGRLSSCVAPDTLILTKRGLIPICEVTNSDFVWTHERRWQPVLEVIEKPPEEMVVVEFCNGELLKCTKSHRLRLPNGRWATVQEIIDEHIEEVDFQSLEHIRGT